jgi:hypothetical protein
LIFIPKWHYYRSIWRCQGLDILKLLIMFLHTWQSTWSRVLFFYSSDQEPYDPTLHHRPDWSAFYKNLEEELPPKIPEPLGKSVTMQVLADANHAGNIVTRRSHLEF